MSEINLIVIAKAPLPGRSKTRLCPPCTPEQAAWLAEAALLDTLATVERSPAQRRVLALEGEPGSWLPPDFEVISQRGESLAERLANAFEDGGGPAIVVGMDTPQLTPALLEQAALALVRPDTDAVLGPAPDGGYWAIGLRKPDRRVFAGVPMSSEHTAQEQLCRLTELGLNTEELPPLRDVDCFDDALAVASEAPHSHFAAAIAHLGEVEAASTR